MLNKTSKLIEPYRKEGKAVVAVFSSAKRKIEVFATQERNAVFLNYLNNPDRNKVVRVLGNEPFRLVANDSHAYLIFRNKIIIVSSKTTKNVSFETIDIKKHWLPVVATINNKHLYLGFNGGEFGGGLYELAIDANGDFSKNTYITKKNIKGLKFDGIGSLLVSTGLAHLVSVRSGLYRYDHGKLDKILEQSGSIIGRGGNFKSSGLVLPALTSIHGLEVTETDNILLAAANLGIISIQNDMEVEYLWRGDLSVGYSGDDSSYSVSSAPMGLLKMKDSIFVASRSLGVFAFKKMDAGSGYIPVLQYEFSE